MNSGNNLFLRVGRFIYRRLGISAYQRSNKAFASEVKDAELSNTMIIDFIQKGEPAMISRFGTPESKCLLNYIEINEYSSRNNFKKIHAGFKGSSRKWNENVKEDLLNLVGVFPVSDYFLEQFSAYYINQIRKVDAIGIWGFVPGETYLIEKFCPLSIKYNPLCLEPYFFANPWSKALGGKKVLVIHPFANSIINQYKKRELLFANRDVLPLFELKTITAVQSIAGNKTEFSTWFEALQSMQKQIDLCEFDVALIGAGSYGLPLSAYIKERGKISVHVGGSLQILFGIKGKRWDSLPHISEFYNEYWVRPSIDEMVAGADKVEEGCYW